MHSYRKRHLDFTLRKEYDGGGEVQLFGREVTMCKDKCPGRQDGLGLPDNKVWGGKEIQAWGRFDESLTQKRLGLDDEGTDKSGEWHFEWPLLN